MKYILAKFRENPIDSNELAAYYVKFKMAAVAKFFEFTLSHTPFLALDEVYTCKIS
jgi:hypothetical protein